MFPTLLAIALTAADAGSLDAQTQQRCRGPIQDLQLRQELLAKRGGTPELAGVPAAQQRLDQCVQRASAEQHAAALGAAEEAQRNEVRERARKMLQDRAWVGSGLSVLRCEKEAERDEALDAIKQEKAAAKLGGVVDMSALHTFQTAAADATAAVRELDAEIAKRKAKRHTCREQTIRQVQACREHWNVNRWDFGEEGAACSQTAGIVDLMVMLDMLDGTGVHE